MSKVTFDRLRLRVPSEGVKIINKTVFTTTVSGDGEPIHMKYEQTSPFYYSITLFPGKNQTEVEFSGKALLEDYPALINHTNITACFENINKCGVCFIDSHQAVDTAYVMQCDVTCDISTTLTIKELYNGINLTASKRWCLRDITSNRFTIESTNTTKRCKSRLVVYDKQEEMTRKTNQSFLMSVTNPEEQMEYFKGKIRYELNLNSIDRIRYFFNIDDTRLSTLYHSNSDPIKRFLSIALKDESVLQQTVRRVGTISELEHLLLLAICDYDLNKVELLIRNIYGATRSIKRCKEPYVNLFDRLKCIIPEPQNNVLCQDISSQLKYMLGLLKEPANISAPNLRKLYHASKQKTPQGKTNSVDGCYIDLFNIDYIHQYEI